jgi:hypothetical protein
MTNDNFREICRDVSYELNISDVDALCDGGDAFVDGVKLGLFYDEARDEGVFCYIDLGSINPANKDNVLAEMMSLNLEMDAGSGEAFGLEPESGHLVLRGFINVDAKPNFRDKLASQLKEYVELAKELYGDLLSNGAVVAPLI